MGEHATPITTATIGARHQGDEVLVSRIAVDALAVGPDSIVVLPRSDEALPITLSKQAFDVFSCASRFSSIDEHACAYAIRRANLRDAPTPGEVREIIVRLLNEGLLRSSANLRATHDPFGVQANTRSISSVGIVTKDRPESLRRCITSLLQNIRERPRKPAIRIYDDSQGDDTESIVRSMAASMNGPSVQLWYAGRKHKESYIQTVATKGNFAPELLEFVFRDHFHCGPTYGANLNGLLVDTSGQIIVTLDDDVVCRTGQKNVQAGVKLSSNYDPTDLWLYRDRHQTEMAVHWEAQDFLMLHESLIGKSVSTCVAEFPCVDMRETGASGVFGDIRRATITATMIGMAGEACTYHTAWFGLPASSRQRVLATKGTYESLRNTKEVIRCVDRVTISEGSFFINTAAALDNRTLLPPFLPIMRNMDGVFAYTLRRCSVDSVFGHVPWVMLHDPLFSYAPRRETKLASHPRVSELIIDFIESCSLRWCSPDISVRLQAIGGEFAEIGRLPESVFRQFLRHACAKHIAKQIVWCEEQLGIPAAESPQWQEDVREHLCALRVALTSEVGCAVDDLCGSLTESHQIALMRKIFSMFGDTLRAWPAICTVCTELRTEGITMAECVG